MCLGLIETYLLFAFSLFWCWLFHTIDILKNWDSSFVSVRVGSKKKRGVWTTGLVFRVIPITDFWGKEKSFILNLMPWFSTTWCVRWWSSLCQFPEIFEISLDQGLFPRIVWTMWWYSKLRNDSADGERELWLTKAPQRRLIKDTWKTAFDPKT